LINSINNNVDALGYGNPCVLKWDVKVPKFSLMMVDKVEDIEKRVKWTSVKREGVGLMLHAGTLCRIDESLALCRNKNYHMKIFTAWLGMSKECLEQYCEDIMGRGPLKTCYPFMEYDEYIKTLDTCRVFLDDNINYYGPSRVSYECASLRIPVVCSTNNYFSMAYPYTTTNPSNVQLQTQLITRLFTEEDFYEKVVVYAYQTMKVLFSDKACLNRFERMLRKIGFQGDV